MELQPKQTKYRKHQKGVLKGSASNTPKLSRGRFALISLSNIRINASQMEAVRRVCMKKLKKRGKLWTLLSPQLSVSKKPLEVRMGKGKGGVSFWGSRIKRGQILYEIDGVNLKTAKQIFASAKEKISMKTKLVYY